MREPFCEPLERRRLEGLRRAGRPHVFFEIMLITGWESRRVPSKQSAIAVYIILEEEEDEKYMDRTSCRP